MPFPATTAFPFPEPYPKNFTFLSMFLILFVVSFSKVVLYLKLKYYSNLSIKLCNFSIYLPTWIPSNSM